jgi:hypothetical protein
MTESRRRLSGPPAPGYHPSWSPPSQRAMCARRAYMVVWRLKVNIRGTAEEVQWRASRNAAAAGGVAVTARLSYENSHAPVAQLDRALPSEGRGHKFESCRARHSTP